jgi:hypothetical protein
VRSFLPGKWKAKLQGEGATREKARGKAETARLMKADNEPISKSTRYEAYGRRNQSTIVYRL